jgi:hypothetical protein
MEKRFDGLNFHESLAPTVAAAEEKFSPVFMSGAIFTGLKIQEALSSRAARCLRREGPQLYVVQDFEVEILRLSSPDSLRMTRGRKWRLAQ